MFQVVIQFPGKIIMNKKIVLSLKYRPKNFDEIIGQETMVFL